jgi:hypothetical protein
MKISVPNCPNCGEPAEGTVDDVPGIALFGEIDENGRTEWGGETRVCWDGQMPRTNDAGEILVQCSEAHEWYTTIDYELEVVAESAPKKSPMDVLKVLVDTYIKNRSNGHHTFVACITPEGIPDYWQDAIDVVEAAEKAEAAPPVPDDSALLVSFEPQAIRDHFEDSDEWGDFVSALSDDELREIGARAVENDQTWKTFDETLITALEALAEKPE